MRWLLGTLLLVGIVLGVYLVYQAQHGGGDLQNVEPHAREQIEKARRR